MKFQNPSFKFFLNGRTSRKQYAPHFFKVGGIMNKNKRKETKNKHDKMHTKTWACVRESHFELQAIQLQFLP